MPATGHEYGKYVFCACRDCMDLAIGQPGALCSDCDAAGCEPYTEDCECPDAYGIDDEATTHEIPDSDDINPKAKG